MQSKLLPLVVCCLLYAVGVGQWSSPASLLSGSSSIEGQSLVAGAGDTMWATVVSTAPCAVYACWTTGDTWSQPVELGTQDPNPVFHDPGMGRDASGRLWAAWYNDSSGVWASFRDSAGWHAPTRVYSGSAAGPMSFAADAAGNWYLGFATLTPYEDYAYSSAVYCRLEGDSWPSPRYIARGMSNPFETNFLAPTLVTRPDSGLWATFDMFTFGDSVAMVRNVQRDTSRPVLNVDGSAPAATADASGRLWVLYSQLAGHWVRAAVLTDSSEVDSTLVSEYSLGRAWVATDYEGIVWAAWKHRTYGSVSVNYSNGGDWSAPEQTSAVAGVPKGIAADAGGRVYVLFQNTAGQLYSVYRTSRPGVQEVSSDLVAGSRIATIVRGVLVLPELGTRSELPERNSVMSRASLLDISGRKVTDLHAGANDVRALAPGVYFVREAQAQAQAQAVRKVVIAR
jgi:hypothetical protein